MSYHARLSPSSADRWSSCTASPAAQDGIPNTGSTASRNGTACHLVLSEVLEAYIRRYGSTAMLGLKVPALIEVPRDYVGSHLVFWHNPKTGGYGESWHAAPAGCVVNDRVAITEDDADAVMDVVQFAVEQHHLMGGTMHIEQRVPVEHITAERGASGSADIVIVGDDWVHVIDAKFGRKPVNALNVIKPATVDFLSGRMLEPVTRPNLQMSLYALGTIHKFQLQAQVRRVQMTIAQPNLNRIDGVSVTLEELESVGKFLSIKAHETRYAPKFEPSKDACMYCRRSGSCEAETELALTTAFESIDSDGKAVMKTISDLTLGDQYALVPFVEQWVKAVEEKVRENLENDTTVLRSDGVSYKLVAGRATAKQWADEAEAERLVKRLNLSSREVYVRKLISPTQFERLLKNKHSDTEPLGGPRQLKKIRNLITQGEGKPQIVLSTNPKPAISKTAGFGDVVCEKTEFADLFGL